MELNDTEKMAKRVIDYLKKNFGDKLVDYNIFDLVDDRNYTQFSIEFKAYDYFNIIFNYERGRIGCSIQYGERTFIDIENSQRWYEKSDFDIFCKELKEDLELRIPDKFLEANGWK